VDLSASKFNIEPDASGSTFPAMSDASGVNGLKLQLVILIMYICFKCYEDGLKLQLVVLIM
jgi:hypothetical protein